ncbi:CD180 protein, partial [Atractosteus spatula]|nr:CD180 protein [Atractosteus spatula]
MHSFFINRGFPSSVIDRALARAKNTPRTINPIRNSRRNNRIPLVLPYHPNTLPIPRTINHNFSILQDDPSIGALFSDRPIISYRTGLTLNFRGNNIVCIEPNTFESCFSGVQKLDLISAFPHIIRNMEFLTHLILNENSFVDLGIQKNGRVKFQKSCLKELSKLEYLKSFNSDLQLKGLFSNLHKLQTLNFSWTEVNMSNTYILEGLQNLQLLSLQGNLFVSGALTDKGIFKHVPKLEVLILSECQITVIADKISDTLTHPRYADLSKNCLVTFNGNAFYSLKNINLNFATNQIEIIAVDNIKGIEKTSKIFLSYNCLVYNCSNVDFISWYEHNLDKMINSEDTVCGLPVTNFCTCSAGCPNPCHSFSLPCSKTLTNIPH